MGSLYFPGSLVGEELVDGAMDSFGNKILRIYCTNATTLTQPSTTTMVEANRPARLKAKLRAFQMQHRRVQQARLREPTKRHPATSGNERELGVDTAGRRGQSRLCPLSAGNIVRAPFSLENLFLALSKLGAHPAQVQGASREANTRATIVTAGLWQCLTHPRFSARSLRATAPAPFSLENFLLGVAKLGAESGGSSRGKFTLPAHCGQPSMRLSFWRTFFLVLPKWGVNPGLRRERRLCPLTAGNCPAPFPLGPSSWCCRIHQVLIWQF